MHCNRTCMIDNTDLQHWQLLRERAGFSLDDMILQFLIIFNIIKMYVLSKMYVFCNVSYLPVYCTK